MKTLEQYKDELFNAYESVENLEQIVWEDFTGDEEDAENFDETDSTYYNELELSRQDLSVLINVFKKDYPNESESIIKEISQEFNCE